MINTILKPGILRVLALLVSSLWLSSLSAQTVQTRVNTDSVSVGDAFIYSITLQLDQEYETIQFPDTSAFPPSVELIERKQFRLSEFSDSISYKLQYFDNEDLFIPPLSVTLFAETDSITLQTDPVTLFFKNVVAEGDTTLKPMQPNFTFTRVWWPWVLAAVLLGGFLYWWFKLRKKEEQTEAEQAPEIKPFHNPLVALEDELEKIKRESDLAVTKDFKVFYSDIGDALRTYFEELYGIPALESTSSELLRYLDAYGIDDTLNEKTRIILKKADLVKFAKFTPTLEDAWQTYEEAIAFLERAKSTDSARIRRLRAKYDAQFRPEPDHINNKES
ncbi:MAG: hypothetical protein CL666_06640 [Balneola sp.]|nr:hypothetical protein [Balneola sp.]|tara:strand:+ start:32655 stop:33653 length:999 start_codon:yes stop_codon:yes gene_type:complete